MAQFKLRIKFNKKTLSDLKNSENSGVEIRKDAHHLALHPIHLKNLKKSIKDLLNEGIPKYNKNLNGILLGYQNVKLISDGGYIHNDSCYIHIDLEAEFFVFRPEIGKEMKGMVNRKTTDHVGVLVYNTFNVAIPKPQNEDNWLGSQTKIGYQVLFKISLIDFSSYLPYIRGEIISILTDIDSGISSESETIKKNKNRKKSFTENEQVTPSKKNQVELNTHIIFDDVSNFNELPVLKNSKKRKLHLDEPSEDMPEAKKAKLCNETIIKPKKKKKDGMKDKSSVKQVFEESMEGSSKVKVKKKDKL